MAAGGDALPRPGQLVDVAMRRLCLSRFAHHELQAVEYFAWALLLWPDSPPELRRGLVAALADEQRHCGLYLDRLDALGGRFDTDDHSDYFWQQAPAMAESPAGIRAFLSGMGLTLEQANLDFTLTYRDAFADAGDTESADICQVVHDDEIAHVALAARWLVRLSGDDASDLDQYLETVPFPLGPARAKGKRFETTPRQRAGLSDTMIDHIRAARVQERSTTPIFLIPNLGAEEGQDLRAYHDQAPVRTAAHLWSLLFSRHACLSIPPGDRQSDWTTLSQRELWPSVLGAEPSEAVFPFLKSEVGPVAWLNTQSIKDTAKHHLAATLTGPAPPIVEDLHDKAFAARQSDLLGLTPRPLAPLVRIIDPDDLAAPGSLLPQLEAELAEWPDWTGKNFTLKPRHGSSGRGRIGGRDSVTTDKIRGALPRLAARGGAIFEPWLNRKSDFSVSLHVPPAADADATLVILGSLEMWTSASGVYRGHCGEVDHRGRVFSGDRDDESLRADAAALTAQARADGFSGPCGVDAFRYIEPTNEDEAGIPRLRSAVEFNARPTMGLVAIGLVKRALPKVRRKLGLEPGDRNGFALTYHAASDREWRKRIYAHVGNDAVIVDLSRASLEGDPQASLVFARDPDSIRNARSEAFRC